MSITTANDLISLALKDAGIVGVGQPPLNEDSNDAFDRLNMMIAQWRRKRWLVWHLIDLSFVSTGAQSYTIGPAGNFVTSVVPDRLEAAFFRQINIAGNPPDYPLSILESREDYNLITLKTLQAFPQYIFYDHTNETNGTIYPWPIPQASLYELHVTIKDVLLQFPTINTAINLPEEYKAALFYNLIVRLRVAYQLPPDPEVNALAKDALNAIRGANAKIPRLQMPGELVRHAHYDIYSDRTN